MYLLVNQSYNTQIFHGVAIKRKIEIIQCTIIQARFTQFNLGCVNALQHVLSLSTVQLNVHQN